MTGTVNPVSPQPRQPRLAIPLGDPAGIGTEVVLKALVLRDWAGVAEITLLGTPHLLQHTLETLSQAGGPSLPRLSQLSLYPIVPPLPLQRITYGKESAATGAASFAYLKTAIEQTIAGQFDGIVTAPIAKSAWKAAGHHYPGQTELLAEAAGESQFGMAFFARSPHTDWRLRTLLATTHIPLRAVPEALTPEVMSRKLALLIHSLHQDFGIDQPRIAIAGLNPHSGEAGQLGREECDWLRPWLDDQRQRYPQVQLDGPIPPDTMWVLPGQAWFGTDPTAMARAHDAYLALYHDQGLIPVKLMGFDRAVNTTIGLPFVRTSPDHGTAFDIAGRGMANPTSMVAAMELAVELVRQRQREERGKASYMSQPSNRVAQNTEPMS
jgi:4-hydroxythreonine-4-phosphate dehydrogenase